MVSSTSKLLSVLALVFGIIGIVLTAVFLFTASGAGTLIAAGVAGLIGVVLGAFGAGREQAKGMSVIGIVLGGLVVLLVIGLYIFALVFVGAI